MSSVPPLDLVELRRELDDVDSQVGELLVRRACLVRMVARRKMELNRTLARDPVLARDPEREAQILARLEGFSLAQEMLAGILAASVEYQVRAGVPRGNVSGGGP